MAQPAKPKRLPRKPAAKPAAEITPPPAALPEPEAPVVAPEPALADEPVAAEPVAAPEPEAAPEAPEPVVAEVPEPEPAATEEPAAEPVATEAAPAEVPVETVIIETVSIEADPVETGPIESIPLTKTVFRFPFLSQESAMSTFPTFDFATPFQTAFSDLQEKTKAAYEKGTAAFGDYNDFAKGNVEALVEAGKILASGLQELTTTLVADSRSSFEAITAEVKELAASKTPTDFLKLQNDIAKKHFDEAVAAASKQTEALVKLANEAAAPITSRVSLAVEKIKTAA